MHVGRNDIFVVFVHRIANAAIGDAHHVKAFFHTGAVCHGLVYGVINALQHGGQNLAGVHVVLVAVHTDGQDAFVCGCLQHANAGAASSSIYHISALADLGFGQLGAFYRVIPSGRCRAGHVGNNRRVRLGCQYTLGIATGEFTDQRDVHAADKADSVGFRCHRSHHANQIRTLVFVEHNRPYVRRIDDHVDDDKVGFRVIASNLAKRVTKSKAGHDDRVGARFGETTQRLFALCFGLQFDFAECFACFLGPTLCASECRFVKGFVELATKVKNQCRLGQCGTSAKGGDGSGTKQFGH